MQAAVACMGLLYRQVPAMMPAASKAKAPVSRGLSHNI
jgi:hypothetical protein